MADILQGPRLAPLSFFVFDSLCREFCAVNSLHCGFSPVFVIYIYSSFILSPFQTPMAVFSTPLRVSQNANSPQALPTTSKPSTPTGQMADRGKENTPPHPPPSQGWLRNPAWIGMCHVSNHSSTFNIIARWRCESAAFLLHAGADCQ